MTFAAPYPYNLAGRPPAKPVAEKPAPCVPCQNKAGEIAYKADRIKTLEREATELREQITNLQAQVNTTAPAPAEYADLHARTHRLAREEAAARAALADCRNDLQDALGKLDRAERTIANRDAQIAMLAPERIAAAAAERDVRRASGWLSPACAERLRAACDRNATAAVFAEILGGAG